MFISLLFAFYTTLHTAINSKSQRKFAFGLRVVAGGLHSYTFNTVTRWTRFKKISAVCA